MIILLSYDLNGHERPDAYEDVKEMIIQNALSSKKPLYSQWLIETDDSIQTWHERMKDVADEDDYWFIVRVSSERQGWLSKNVWEWLRART